MSMFCVVLSLFTIVSFKNDACQSNTGTNGTCYSSNDCTSLGLDYKKSTHENNDINKRVFYYLSIQIIFSEKLHLFSYSFIRNIVYVQGVPKAFHASIYFHWF